MLGTIPITRLIWSKGGGESKESWLKDGVSEKKLKLDLQRAIKEIAAAKVPEDRMKQHKVQEKTREDEADMNIDDYCSIINPNSVKRDTVFTI